MLLRPIQFFAFSIILALFLWLGGLAGYVISIYNTHNLYPKQKTDAIVVLTGGNYRIPTGLDLWSKLYAPELFISGVHEKNTRKSILSGWVGEGRLPLCCLTLDFKATTTRENAIQTKKWVDRNDIHSIRLVTSDYHMPRALLELKTQMPNLKIIPHPVQIYQSKKGIDFSKRLLIMEYNKFLFRQFEILTGREWITRGKV
ncbi:MAG: YdcF family protein [Alphaproteobacteria bacterium]